MNTSARVELEFTAKRPGDRGQIVVKRSAKTAETELLLGDGKAEVGWTTPLRLSSEYSRVVVGGSARVFLHCNQDDSTISGALKVCKSIATKHVKEEYPKLKALLKELDAEILRETGSQRDY